MVREEATKRGQEPEGWAAVEKEGSKEAITSRSNSSSR
jgi:hypothetical protein